jgi:hypothetical protein
MPITTGNNMFDFVGFLETHKLADTVLILALIIMGTLIYREISRWMKDSTANHLILEDSSSAVKRIEALLNQHAKRAEELCDGKDCANFEKVAASVYQLRDIIIKFENDSRESRSVTAESVQRIERNINTFTSELGVEVMRFLREERGKR